MADETREVLRQRAIRYKSSHPGSPFDDNNIQVNSYCLKLLNTSNNFTIAELETMRRALDYRLFKIMQQATAYMTAIMRGMEMPLPRCEDWDSDSFLVPSILTGKSAEVIKKYYNTLKTIQDMKLFDDPGEDEGLPYDKGVKYMVAVVLRQDLDDEVLVAYLEYAKENFKLKPEQLGGPLQEQQLRRRSTIDPAVILNM